MVEITKLGETEEAEDTTQAESDDSDTSENKAIVNVEKSENASETSEIETETSEVNLAESLPVEDTQTNEIPDVDKAFGNFQVYFFFLNCQQYFLFFMQFFCKSFL